MDNNQRDSRWAHAGLGDGSTTIGASGCTVSALGNVLGLTPDVVNEKLKAVGGFLGALIIWKKIEEAFPGVKINRVWSYNNDDVLAHIPNVIVEVPAAPIGGTGSHWVNYIGNHQLKDPWTGTVRPTSDFPNPTGYCTIDISGYTPQQDPLQACLAQHTTLVDLCNQKDATIIQLKSTNETQASEIQILQDKITSLEGQVSTLNETNTGLKQNVSEVQTRNSALADQISQMEKADSTAVDTGLNAQAELKNELADKQLIANDLGASSDTKGIRDAITGLKGQLVLAQKAKQDQAKKYSNFVQTFINIFLKKK